MFEGKEQRLGWGWVLVGFGLFFFALISPLLTLSVEPKWDAIDYFYPAFSYLADAIRAGRFPLWDPFTNCGYPYLAEPQHSTLNPLAILLGWLIPSTAFGFVLFWGLNWFWAGLGMLKLAKYFGASPAGAFASAVGYVFSGFFIAHAEHTPYVVVGAWLPWVLVFADRAVGRRKWSDALMSGACLGICSYGGYPGLILFVCLVLAIWLCFRYLLFDGMGLRQEPLARLGRVVGVLALVGLVFVLIWSPILHAFLTEGRGYTHRVNPLDPDLANYSHPFSLSAMISLLFPYATIVGKDWMGADISMTNGYVGILTLPLALFWLRKGASRKGRVGFLLLVGSILLVSMGGEYGLRTLLYHVYPPMQYMRYSAPFRLFWILPIVLAAGMGLSRLIQNPSESRLFARFLALWLMVEIFIAAGYSLFGPVNIFSFYRSYLVAFLLVFLAALGGWLLSISSSSRFRKGVPLLLVFLISIDMGWHLYNNRLTVWSETKLFAEVEPYHRNSSTIVPPLKQRISDKPFGNVNLQQVIKVPQVLSYVTMRDKGFRNVLVDSRFLEILSSPMRYWLSPGVETASSAEMALSVLTEIDANSPVPVFVDQPVSIPSAARARLGEFGIVRVRSYEPEKVQLYVYVPGRVPAFLASTERYAAGWEVAVDGVEQEVVKTNLYFRGTRIPPGEHEVVWQYRPKHWTILAALSYMTLLVALGSGFYWRRKDVSEGARD